MERWPSLQKVQKAKPETLRKFFIQRHSCKLDNIDRCLEEIRRALPATHDAAVTCSCSAAVLALVRIVRAVRDAIVCYDQQIETLAREHPDFAIIDSLPGVGPALAPAFEELGVPGYYSLDFRPKQVGSSPAPSITQNECMSGLRK